jgi:uncharacterized sulfatase
MGDPREIKADGRPGPENGAYHDIDFGTTRNFLVQHQDRPELNRFLQLAVAKRPVEELFDITKDPGCLHNLAADPEFAKAREELALRMTAYLKETGDPRVLGNGDVWETYPRYSNIRKFPPPPAR